MADKKNLEATENTEEPKKGADKGAVIRTAVLVLAIANNILALFGKSPLPISDDQLTQIISYGFSVVASLVAWWYNNDFTIAAKKGTALTHQLKEEKKAEKKVK